MIPGWCGVVCGGTGAGGRGGVGGSGHWVGSTRNPSDRRQKGQLGQD